MIRVGLPYHLRVMAQIDGEVRLQIDGPATLNSVLDALESHYPVLRGTIRDRDTGRRRPFLRYFACATDLSRASPDARLPHAVTNGEEPLLVVAGLAGG